ncbi:MAG: TauD/TfdA family dioxygenase [Gammaproteobacteria bacterium]|nr:TauD/TfdA family dioxygenase [Gammaproteobacteria bacterium]
MSSTVQASPAFTVERRHPLIGTAVHGLDLSRRLEQTTVDALHALWMEHLLLVFPGQAISDEQHVAFARCFGELEIHPSFAHRSTGNQAIYRVSNVDEDGNLIPQQDNGWQYLSQSWRWHTDSSFRDIPSKGSILHGIEITRDGGNTLFANLYAAYEDLPYDMRARIDDLIVVHDHDHILSLSPLLAARKDKGRYETLPPVRHPLVQVHPVTGRRSLFLSPHTMTAVDGLGPEEGRALLDELIAHATQPRYVYRHCWEPHDVIMWDNRCTMHSVEPFDNTNLRRVMHRVTLAGEGRPIPARA